MPVWSALPSGVRLAVRDAARLALGTGDCLGCEALEASGDSALCAPCEAVGRVDEAEARCPLCDSILCAGPRTLCRRCAGLGLGATDAAGDAPFLFVRAPLRVAGPVARVLRAACQSGVQRAVRSLCHWLWQVRRVRACLQEADAIAFVPSEPRVVLATGLHAAGLLAKALSAWADKPLLKTTRRARGRRIVLLECELQRAHRFVHEARRWRARGAQSVVGVAVGYRDL